MSGLITTVAVNTAVFLGAVYAAGKFIPQIAPLWVRDGANDILTAIPIIILINGIAYLFLNGLGPLAGLFTLVPY